MIDIRNYKINENYGHYNPHSYQYIKDKKNYPDIYCVYVESYSGGSEINFKFNNPSYAREMNDRLLSSEPLVIRSNNGDFIFLNITSLENRIWGKKIVYNTGHVCEYDHLICELTVKYKNSKELTKELLRELNLNELVK